MHAPFVVEMHFFCYAVLAAAASAMGLPNSAAPGTVLEPINVVAFESAVRGLGRRSDAPANFADLAPAQDAQLVYGMPSRDGQQLLLANITLRAPSGMPIVMMERLEALTSAVDCSAGGGNGGNELSVTWTSDEAYAAALRSWEFINEDKELQFLIITNHKGCGPDKQRAAYRITDVETDEVKRITRLKAVRVAWKDITGTYTMDFGRAALRTGAAKRLRARGFGDFFKEAGRRVEGAAKKVAKAGEDALEKAKELAKGAVDRVADAGEDAAKTAKGIGEGAAEKIAEGAGDLVGGAGDVVGKIGDAFQEAAGRVGDEARDAANAAEKVAGGVAEALSSVAEDIRDIFESAGDADLSNSIEFDVSGGKQGDKKNIFTDPLQPPRLIVDCVNCFLAGKLKVAGTVKVENFEIIDFSLTIAPRGLVATAEIDTTLAAGFTPDELNSLTTAGTEMAFDLVKLDSSTDLIQTPVLGAGLVVTDIFSIGLIASIQGGFALGFKGQSTFSVGVAVSLPDSALIKLDLADLRRSSATGFESAVAKPVLRVANASASIDASLFLRPTFSLKVQVASVGQLSADIRLGLPQINAGASTKFNEKGVCPGSPEKTALLFKVGGRLDVVVGVTSTIANQGGQVAEKELTKLDLFSLERCVPFALDASPKAVTRRRVL